VPEVTQRFACALDAPREARRFAVDTLARWACDDLIPTAEVVVSELATNAVIHAHSTFVLSLRRERTTIRLAVRDFDETAMPEPRPLDDERPHGRGLFLVGAFAERWGTERHPGGKTVWADLVTP
jgi:anti-sigma regulatory factor (Ser/Thr protein kinase)